MVTTTIKQLQQPILVKWKQRRIIEFLGWLGTSSSCTLSFNWMHGMDGSSFSYVNPPNKNASEKVITAEPHQSENANGTIAQREEVITSALSILPDIGT